MNIRNHPLIRAEQADVHPVTACVADAFQALDVAAWLVPDPVQRPVVIYRNLRLYVEHALRHGTVWATLGWTGVAIWLPRDRPLPEIVDYDERLTAACGPFTGRFRALDEAFATHHPGVAHQHLALLAVHPAHQGKGIGSALLDEEHPRLDEAGMPAYLEASSDASRLLYLRHGYLDHADPIRLGEDGPTLWPMWRDPHPPGRGWPPLI